MTLKSAEGVVRSGVLSIESGKSLVSSLFMRNGDSAFGESGSMSIGVLKYCLLDYLMA